jgi:hypothetical protein
MFLFLDWLLTPSAGQLRCHNCKLERVWQEAAKSYLEPLSQQLLKGSEQTHGENSVWSMSQPRFEASFPGSFKSLTALPHFLGNRI